MSIEHANCLNVNVYVKQSVRAQDLLWINSGTQVLWLKLISATKASQY